MIAAVNKAARRDGFTLLEMLLVIAGMGVLMTISTIIVIEMFRMHNVSRDMLERQGACMGLFDQFRADVAQAADTPPKWGEQTANATCLILSKPDGKHVVYRLEAERLKRWERNTPEGKPLWVELEPTGVEVEFLRRGPESRLVTLRLKQVSGRGASKRPMEVTAALGGDLR